MPKPPRGPSICPDCKGLVRALNERCPTCGRLADWMRPRPWYAEPWVRWVGLVAALWLAGVWVLTRERPPVLVAGGHAVVRHEGANGAWFAVDGESFGRMVDGQNQGSRDLLNYLFSKGKTFREPNGSRVLVLEVGVGSAFVQVRAGANVGSEGWVQREFLDPVTEAPPPP